MEGPAPTQAPHGVCFHPAPTLEASRGCWLASTHPGCWLACPAGCGACRGSPGTAGSRMPAPRRPRSGWVRGCLGRPSEDHESEISRVRLCNPMACSLPGFCIHGIFQAKSTWVGMGCRFLLQGNFSDLGIEPGSLALQADSLLSEPLGKPPDNHEPSLDPLLVVLGVQFPSLPSTLNHATKFTPHQDYLRTSGLSAPADRGVCRQGI